MTSNAQRLTKAADRLRQIAKADPLTQLETLDQVSNDIADIRSDVMAEAVAASSQSEVARRLGLTRQAVQVALRRRR